MKKFNLFLYMLLGITMAFAVACGSDDDDNGGSGDMDTPKYEAKSALYRVTDRSSQYESVEFTASGNYIITKKEGTRAPQQIAAVRRSMIMALPQAGRSPVSRQSAPRSASATMSGSVPDALS